MSWLLLSVICSTLIFVLFKLFDRWRVDNLLAIVVNYIIAYLVGGFDHNFEILPWHTTQQPWFSSVVILGFLFITLFQIMAFVSQKIGVSVVSVAVKMSLIIPVLYGIIYYREELSFTKAAGIIMALLAVYLATRKKEKTEKKPAYAWLPVFLFIASGCMDVFIKHNQQEIVPFSQQSIFASSIFGMAGLIGLILLVVQTYRQKVQWNLRSIWAGIALGIPNYGSIYFLLRALEYKGIETSVVFPINNVGIVALSALIAYFGFKEHLSGKNIAGILLSFAAIALIAFDNFF